MLHFAVFYCSPAHFIADTLVQNVKDIKIPVYDVTE